MSMSSTNDRVAEAVNDAKDDGYIIGTVTDNKDPKGIGRIKVKVPDLFDPDKGDVPWIGPSKQSPFGIGSGYGVYGSPAIGSQVRIELQDGDAHYGLMVADEYTVANANSKFKTPDTWGFKDPSGNELFVNMTTQDWQFTHSSGLKLSYDKNGNRILIVPKDDTVTITGDSDTTIKGDETVSITGDATRTVGGDETNSVTGDQIDNVTGALSIVVQGNLTATSSGAVSIVGAAMVSLMGTAAVNIVSAGPVNITGNPINLN